MSADAETHLIDFDHFRQIAEVLDGLAANGVDGNRAVEAKVDMPLSGLEGLVVAFNLKAYSTIKAGSRPAKLGRMPTMSMMMVGSQRCGHATRLMAVE